MYAKDRNGCNLAFLASLTISNNNKGFRLLFDPSSENAIRRATSN